MYRGLVRTSLKSIIPIMNLCFFYIMNILLICLFVRLYKTGSYFSVRMIMKNHYKHSKLSVPIGFFLPCAIIDYLVLDGNDSVMEPLKNVHLIQGDDWLWRRSFKLFLLHDRVAGCSTYWLSKAAFFFKWCLQHQVHNTSTYRKYPFVISSKSNNSLFRKKRICRRQVAGLG